MQCAQKSFTVKNRSITNIQVKVETRIDQKITHLNEKSVSAAAVQRIICLS